MKNYNMILTEKEQKYQNYYPEKLINMNILPFKEILPSNQRHIIEQAKFAYSPLGKAFEEQTNTIKKARKKQTKTIEEQRKKQVQVLEVLKPEEDKEEIKSVEEPFPKELRNNEIKT